jgi:flagellar protein FliO/FliZ
MTPLAQPASPLSVGSLTQLTLSLLAIVALIFAIGWILKRFKLGTPRGSIDAAVLEELKVGPRERIVLVRVGAAQILVGISAGGIVPLTPLAAPIELKPSAAPSAFADRLREVMKRGGSA